MSRNYLILVFCISIITSCKCNTNPTAKDTSGDGSDEALAVAGIVTANPAITIAAVSDTNKDETPVEDLYANSDKAKLEMVQRKTAYKKNATAGFYPEGSERKLTVYDIQYLSAWGQNVMLNEIYARHGMIFADKALDRHFRKQKWYKPVSNNIFQRLTQVEKENIAFLINHTPESK
jgi:hypothetical protein